MNDKTNEHNISFSDLDNEIGKTKEILLKKQEKLILNAQYTGFSIDALEKASSNFKVINENTKNYPEVTQVISSAYHQFVALNCNLIENDRSITDDLEFSADISGSIITSCSSSESIAMAIEPKYNNNLVIPSFLQPDINKVKNKLYTLDPSLAKTYEEIEQVYYATNADNTRSALSIVRQTFDHFFEKLAPDEYVRNSKYWKSKKGEDDPNLVTRRERIIYAINTHIKSQYKARQMEKDVKLIIDSYKALNSLHKRGNINLTNSKKALYTIKHFLEEFTRSMND